MRTQRALHKIIVLNILWLSGGDAYGQPPREPATDAQFSPSETARPQRTPLALLPESLSKLVQDAVALNPSRTVYLNRSKKKVYLHTEVSCRSCVLEMLCVPVGQREHETILNVRARAFVIHAALTALGLKHGRPVVFYPDYRPPEGPELDLRVHWLDNTGKPQSQDARSWIRHSIHRYFAHPLSAAPPGIKLPHEELRYDPFNKEILWYGPMTEKQREHLLSLWDDSEYRKAIGKFYRESQSRPMKAVFVFTGSRWHTDERSGRRQYAAEGGHFITVANFPSSTIDVAEPSSSSEGNQTYEAWEQRIPPEGTPVILEIGPAGQKPGNRAVR